MLLPLGIMARQNNILKQQVQKQFNLPPTATPTPFSTPTTKPTAKPVTRTIQPTVEADPPVHCNISDHCGGGTRPLKQSECDNMTCCQTKDGWEFMLKTKCDSLHGSYDKEVEKINSRTAVFVGSFTRYCDESAHQAIKDAYSAWQSAYESDVKWAKTVCADKASLGDMTAYTDCYNSNFGYSNIMLDQYNDLISRHCN